MAPVLVKSTKFDRGFAGSTTAPATFGSALVSGNILIAMATIGANTTVSFSDTVNTWTTVTSRYWANVGSTVAIGWAQNTSASALTVTATFGASASFGTIVVGEFSGVATTTPVDVFTVGANVSANATPSDVSMTTTANGDLIISAIGSDGSTPSAGAGFTLVDANTGTSMTGLEYQVQGTAGSIAATWTLAGAVQSIPISAAFLAASITPDSLPAVSVAVSVTGSVSKANAAGVSLIESTEPLDGWGATTNPKVSPTVDVQAGDILVAFGIGKDSGTSIFPTAPTNSGTALTWTRKVNQSGGGTSPVAIYTATAVATETITVTLTLTTSTGPWSFRLLQWRGAIGVGASLGNAQAPAAVQPAITLAATGRRSVIISGHSDANAIDASARVWNTVNSSVMAEASYYRLASSYAVMVGYSTDAGNGGSLALGLTGTGAGTHNWASGAIEILAPLTPSPPSTRSFAIPRAARW